MGVVERTCWCGKKFQAREADVRRGWAKACSKAHAAHAREKKLDRFGFQRGESGTFHNRMADLREGPECDKTFSNAHLFSNEEHDCNKE